MLGGKLTDYRIASRKVAGLVARHLGIGTDLERLPVIDYDRHAVDDPVQYDLDYECAITVDDIVRRREGSSIYSMDAGASMKRKAETHLAGGGA